MMSKKKNSLKIIKSIQRMEKIALLIKGRGKVSFVPTMGALHDGHIALVKKAKKVANIVIVSIFVNPIQFSEKKDLKTYPRTLKNDIKKLKDLGVDYVFIPNAQDLFNQDFQTKVTVQNFQNHLCGISRKNHFDGVTTIVLKLFNIVKPDQAIFGKKDMQQLIIIKTMVRELNMDIKIIPHKIIREKEGLAMSSRNNLLNNSEKKLANNIYQGLKIAKNLYSSNKKVTSSYIKAALKKTYKDAGIKNIEYIEIMNPKQMSYPKKPSKKDFIAVAVRIGNTRLIDNLEF